ncbi:MAG: Fe(2+)-trafficking protein [Phycisphaeraceae bacterium]|nr:Fe(2+)-trafficking protein [Phycisphaeraceae bacterium]
MTQADPENAMGWFSLGSAYKDAGRPEDAVKALETCIERDETYSRAYQMLGQVLIHLGRREDAGRVLTQGYTTAAQRGDEMPRKAMGKLLETLGKPVPEVADAAPKVELGPNQIIDRRTGQPGNRMPDPPMRGKLGRYIHDHFSQETWREWIGMGTKVINELRLDFSNPDHQDVYEQHMLEWLGISREEVDAYVPEDAGATGR